ncbi:pyruvate oxidase [Lentilactobacillus farraginis]|uniref:Pyruvate oxidase n=2 Tax=Lentilactobacillus farraginis DSM 18382 = JCM 14108 TaxID=1423743 RepID=A0A0R1W3N1_9LACO|nr:pyruvate oxidase [Lentilactobacillus farraginis]KRM12221.1 pyruvate oxidase [Lentilactobacillus farraginis DSM 18382 = JCM 14108]
MVEKISGSDAVLKVLEQWGVTNIYGLPGGSFDSTMNAIHNQKNKINFIQVRHEEAGAIAASASAKLTGKVGVCFGSAGPGAVHLLNGLYDAKSDGVPVVALVAQVPTSNMNMDFFQAMDEEPIFDDVAVWNRTAMTAEALPRMTDEAIRQAYMKHGVAVLTIPKDLGWAQINDTYEPNVNSHTEPAYPDPRPEDVTEAVKLIKEAKSPMIYFGLGAKDAADELKAASEKFKMPLVSSVLAKGIIDDNYPAYLGSTGRVAPKPGAEIGFSTDLILWVGNDVPFSIFLFNKKAKVIQIDIESEKLGKRRHNDVSMLADSKKALQAILDAGEERKPSAFYQAALADKTNWLDWQNSFKDSTEKPVRPEPIFDVINQTASDKAIFAVDVGNVNINFERLIDMHGDQKWATSGIYATMGFALPTSIAAKLEYPDRDVYSLSGDGGFAMLMEEVMTQVKYGLHVVNVIFSNETLGYIQAEQTDDTHQPLSGVDLPDTDWQKVAEGMGAVSYTVRTKDDMKQAMAEADKTDKPVVIDVKLTHKMPLTTQHMFIDPAWQDQKKIDEFVKKYQAQDLKPFSYFLKEAQEGQLQTN